VQKGVAKTRSRTPTCQPAAAKVARTRGRMNVTQREVDSTRGQGNIGVGGHGNAAENGDPKKKSMIFVVLFEC